MGDAAGLESEGLDIDLGGFDFGDVFDGWIDSVAAPEPEPPIVWPEAELDQRGRARDRAHGGRPSLYTTPRVLAILAALFKGESRADAARRAGVGVSTFYVWLQLGRKGHPTFAPLAEAVENVEEARAFNVAFGHAIRCRGFWKAFP